MTVHNVCVGVHHHTEQGSSSAIESFQEHFLGIQTQLQVLTYGSPPQVLQGQPMHPSKLQCEMHNSIRHVKFNGSNRVSSRVASPRQSHRSISACRYVGQLRRRTRAKKTDVNMTEKNILKKHSVVTVPPKK